MEKLKLWENGRTLKVKFLDGNAAVQAKVQAVAKEWGTASPTSKLEFVASGTAQIRISFAEGLLVDRGHRRADGGLRARRR